jgi:hypothetical protein
MISSVIFYFLSTITLLFYPISTLLTIFYSLMIVYIYNKCNIKNYKSMSCIFLILLVILFYLLDIKLIIVGAVLLLMVIICITNMFNNNILSMCDNNNIVNMLWKGNSFIISFLLYIYAPIYKYFDIGINKLVNLLISPKLIKTGYENNGCNELNNNDNDNELKKLESIFKNINEQMEVSHNPTQPKLFQNTNLAKGGYNNKHKFKNNRNNIDKQTKELFNMFEQLSNIIKEQT